jgi:predicted component of type VI protein secretion system
MDDDELSAAETDDEWEEEAQHMINMLNERLDALERFYQSVNEYRVTLFFQPSP